MTNVGSIQLSNNNKLPLLGLGTWQATNENQVVEALQTALDTGYRYIDTADAYNNEEIIGKVIEKYIHDGKLKREDIFVTSKLPSQGHRNPEIFIERSLNRLRTDYIDLYLIHSPMPYLRDSETNEIKKDESGKEIIDLVPFSETWKIFEKYYDEGKLKAIGISNFNEKQIQQLYDQARIKPHNLQVECHILNPQKELFEFCKNLNISFTAYAPIGSPGRIAVIPGKNSDDESPMKHPIVEKLAKKYHKSPAQILIRQMIQRGISTIPKSTNPKRIKENFNVFDFELTAKEMEEFNSINKNIRLFRFTSKILVFFSSGVGINTFLFLFCCFQKNRNMDSSTANYTVLTQLPSSMDSKGFIHQTPCSCDDAFWNACLIDRASRKSKKFFIHWIVKQHYHVTIHYKCSNCHAAFCQTFEFCVKGLQKRFGYYYQQSAKYRSQARILLSFKEMKPTLDFFVLDKAISNYFVYNCKSYAKRLFISLESLHAHHFY